MNNAPPPRNEKTHMFYYRTCMELLKKNSEANRAYEKNILCKRPGDFTGPPRRMQKAEGILGGAMGRYKQTEALSMGTTTWDTSNCSFSYRKI